MADQKRGVFGGLYASRYVPIQLMDLVLEYILRILALSLNPSSASILHNWVPN